MQLNKAQWPGFTYVLKENLNCVWKGGMTYNYYSLAFDKSKHSQSIYKVSQIPVMILHKKVDSKRGLSGANGDLFLKYLAAER